jgi:hypothetical protein
MQIKKPLLHATLLLALTTTFITCRRELQPRTGKTNPVASAKKWFYQTFEAETRLNSNGQLVSGTRYPDWRLVKQYSNTYFNVVEAPLLETKYTRYRMQLPAGGRATAADSVPASIKKLCIFEHNGHYKEAVMTIVASPAYFKQQPDLSSITPFNLPPTFSGFIFYETFTGQFLKAFLIDSGRAVKRYAPQQAARARTETPYTADPIVVLETDCGDCYLNVSPNDVVLGIYCPWAFTCNPTEWTPLPMPVDCEGIQNPFNCPCQNGMLDLDNCGFGNGGGGGDEPPYDPNSATSIIIDTSISNHFPCLTNLLQTMPNVNREAQLLLDSVFGEKTKMNLTFVADYGLYNTNYPALTYPTSAFLGASGVVKTFNDTIFINPYFITRATKEFMAGALYHEAIHAYINYHLYKYSIGLLDSNFIKEKFSIFWNKRMGTYSIPGSGLSQQQHEEIAANYLNTMKTLIKQFYNSSASLANKEQVSESLAWGGLRESTVWQLPGKDTCQINLHQKSAGKANETVTYSSPSCGFNFLGSIDLDLSQPCN